MSGHLLIASFCFALLAVVIFGRAATSTIADSIEAEGRLTHAQARLVRDGLSFDDAMAIPDECARRCTFNIAREFPLVCDCPGGP